MFFEKKIRTGILPRRKLLKACELHPNAGWEFPMAFIMNFYSIQNFVFRIFYLMASLNIHPCLFLHYVCFLHIFCFFFAYIPKISNFFEKNLEDRLYLIELGIFFCFLFAFLPFLHKYYTKKSKGCNIIWGFNIKWLIPILTCILIEFYHILIFINVFPFSLFFFDFRSEFFNCIYFKK